MIFTIERVWRQKADDPTSIAVKAMGEIERPTAAEAHQFLEKNLTDKQDGGSYVIVFYPDPKKRPEAPNLET